MKPKPFIAIIVQARMKSTRLKGKVLKTILGCPMLSYLVERLKKVKSADTIVIATTTCKEDDAIRDFCRRENVPFYRGSEENVLERFFEAAKKAGADVVVRITADCPLIDPNVVEDVIAHFLEGNFDYVGNTLELTYPRGMDTEVFSIKTLEKSFAEAKRADEREHVTLYMYRHPEKFKLANVSYKQNLAKLRLTVDTLEDFHVIEKVIEALYPKKHFYTLEDIVNFLEKNPQVAEINRHIVQKAIKES